MAMKKNTVSGKTNAASAAPACRQAGPATRWGQKAAVHAPLLLTVALMLWVWVHFAIRHGYILTYFEEQQMFLFTTDYFMERIAVPGGMARYAAEFLVQFCRWPWLGALLTALAFGALTWLCWLTACRSDRRSDRAHPTSSAGFVFALLPALLLWGYMADTAVMPAYIVALVAAVAVCTAVDTTRKNLIILLAAIPVVYHLCGTTVYIVTLYATLRWLQRRGWLQAAVLTAWTATIVGISTAYTPWPESRIFLGIPYYIHVHIPAMQVVLMALTATCCLLAGLTSQTAASHQWSWARRWWLGGIALIIAGGHLAATRYNDSLHDVMNYNAMVKAERWDDILQHANEGRLVTTMSVAATDLALAVKGQLPRQMAIYPQNGPEGLFMNLQDDQLSLLTVGEIFFRLGMMNEAQRYFFDAQESVTDYNRSVRLTARLAEIELVNGEYDAAKKYLHTLQHTLFYRHWAEERLQLIALGDQAIDSHPTYGPLRRFRPVTDYMYHPDHLFDNLRELCTRCPDNVMAAQYLQAATILAEQRFRNQAITKRRK